MSRVQPDEFPGVVWPSLDYFATLSKQLLDRGIPCVIWGATVLAIYGVRIGSDGPHFVVPDSMIPDALQAMKDLGLTQCDEDEATCRRGPRGVPHFHLELQDYLLRMFPQSEILPMLQPLKMAPDSDAASIVRLSELVIPDGRRGKNRVCSDAQANSNIFIPTANCFLEAVVRLLVRNHGEYRYHTWKQVSTYIAQVVWPLGYLNEASLHPRILDYLNRLAFKPGYDKPFAAYEEELIKAFGDATTEGSVERDVPPY